MKLQSSVVDTNGLVKIKLTGSEFKSDGEFDVYLLEPEALKKFEATRNSRSPIIESLQWTKLSNKSPIQILLLASAGEYGIVWDGNELDVTIQTQK